MGGTTAIRPITEISQEHNNNKLNHLKTIQKVPEQHTGKARYDIKGTTQNIHIWHCTLTAGSADVKYKTFNMGYSIICVIYCNNRIAATVYRVGTLFVSGVYNPA